ncbi:spondin domain-containing protein [Thalassotalea eurytherma]|uniref:Spondin domain-containing protein n=1 Tax=Thalassotalea eurytherma TaxID=1144278 RepID=A0ABQ6H619_9GAMM|nr:spondin domain-containing protein [Thalassotalea eurytherma]GLX82610.1 hypothetical protein theurythT_20620 [Thalassotalea eurytherma]
MKGKLLTLSALMALSPLTMAQQLEVTVTNLTNGIHYTPLVVTAHTDAVSLFTLGESASAELQAMAEGGDISGLVTVLGDASADVVENPAGGLLAPAASTTAMLDTDDANMYLSVAGMMLPTNDGFVALNSWPIPTEAGTYTVYLNAYDAGTEANDEIINGGGASGTPGIPVAPGGDGGTGATGVTSTEANEMVHVHRGALGDDDPAGGKSDLDNTVHRWLNPVAKVTVVVM